MPRLHFPPIVLALRDFQRYQYMFVKVEWGVAYSFVPLQKLLGQIVLLGMIEYVLNELGKD